MDDPLPTLETPLAEDDRLIFGLTPAYHQTFERTHFYQSVVDYEQFPLQFETYHPADQERIKARMAALQVSQPES